MTAVQATVLSALLSAVAVVAVSLITKHQSRRAREESRRAQDLAAALERDKVDLTVFESSVEELRAQLTDLRTELRTERQARVTAEAQAREADERARQAERTADEERAARRSTEAVVERLTVRVEVLERALSDARIPVPH